MYTSNLMDKRKIDKIVKYVRNDDEKSVLIENLLSINIIIYNMYAKLTGGNDQLDLFKIMDYNDDSFESIRIKLHERSDIFKRIRELEPSNLKYRQLAIAYSLEFV
jgi:DNA polymerase III delta prime subunit